MTVYIEYVIIDNLIIDYLMLKATFAITGKTCSRGRLFICALFGAAVALLYPLLETTAVILTAVKICSGFLIVLIAGDFNAPRAFFVNAGVFFAYTFLTGGAITGIFSLCGLSYSSEFSVAFMVAPVYAVLRAFGAVVCYAYKRKDVARLTYKVTLKACGRELSGKGFMDTGNGLYDGLRPVIVCGESFFKKIVGDDILRIKFKKIKVNTVSGQSENLAFELDSLKIYISDEPNIYNNVTVCVAGKCAGDGYDVILHPALLENVYVEEYDAKTEKIS